MTKYCNVLHKLVVTSNDVQQKILFCSIAPRHNKSLSRLPAICLYGEPPASAVIQFGLVSLFRLAFRNTVISNRNGNHEHDNKTEQNEAKHGDYVSVTTCFPVENFVDVSKEPTISCLVYSLSLKIEVRHSSKMSVNFY